MPQKIRLIQTLITMYTTKKIFKELSSKFTREAILNCARNDREKPYGFLICFIRDNYGLPKMEGHEIAMDLLKFFNINND